MNKTCEGDRPYAILKPIFPLKLACGEIIQKNRRQRAERRQTIFISNQPFCFGLPPKDLEPLLSKGEKRAIVVGEVLLSPGEENHYLYFLVDGLLKVHIESVENEKGFLIEPGECVGEISIIDGKPPTAFVVAKKPSVVLCIHEELLWSEFFQIPGAARNFLRQMAERMRVRNLAIQHGLEQHLRMQHLEKELEIAHDIQASMLPQQNPLFPNYPQVDVSVHLQPAKEVGGDFYDAFPLDERRICIAIGDVSGKGVPAALFMVKTITLLRIEVLKHPDLVEAITNLNLALSIANMGNEILGIYSLSCSLGQCSMSIWNPLFAREPSRCRKPTMGDVPH